VLISIRYTLRFTFFPEACMNNQYRCAVQIKEAHNVCDCFSLFELFKFFNDNLFYNLHVGSRVSGICSANKGRI